MLQTADGGYEQIHNMLIRLKELATQAADASLNSNNRNAISSEAAQLLSEIERIAQSTVFNGLTLINTAGNAASSLPLSFYVGDGSLSSATNQIIFFTLQGINASQAGGVCIGAGAANFALGAVCFTSVTQAALLVDTAQNAIISLSGLRTNLGAVVNRLERAQSNIQQMIENASDAESTIRDADFATETAALTRAQILVQSGTSLLQQANLLPQNALLLLQG